MVTFEFYSTINEKLWMKYWYITCIIYKYKQERLKTERCQSGKPLLFWTMEMYVLYMWMFLIDNDEFLTYIDCLVIFKIMINNLFMNSFPYLSKEIANWVCKKLLTFFINIATSTPWYKGNQRGNFILVVLKGVGCFKKSPVSNFPWNQFSTKQTIIAFLKFKCSKQ